MLTRVVHCKKEPYDIYIGRGRGSVWGNPYTHKQGTLAEFIVPTVAEAIKRYESWIKQQPQLISRLGELRGKTLGCWCKPGPCHGDVLARLADESATDGSQFDCRGGCRKRTANLTGICTSCQLAGCGRLVMGLFGECVCPSPEHHKQLEKIFRERGQP